MPRQIILMRHAEKPDDPTNPKLSPQGRMRAQQLATYIPKTFKHIDFLFAAAPSKHSVRPIETIKPLAQAIGAPINKDIADQDYPVLAHHLLTHQKYDGSLVVACWHHGHLPDLAEALGASSEAVGGRWDDAVFNLIWQLDYPPATAVPTLIRVWEPF
jgi:broad specificity phosphatase PhoE